MTKIIDGKAIAAKVRADVAADVAFLKREPRLRARPRRGARRRGSGEQGLRAQQGRADRRGRHAVVRAQAAGRDHGGGLLALVAKLNADPAVNGILVQLPLPKHIDSEKVLERSTRPRTSTASTR